MQYSVDLIQKTKDAKREASAACELDESFRYYDAIQKYDQAISIIDDILGQIPSDIPVWEQLILFRQTYSDRMVRFFIVFLFL